MRAVTAPSRPVEPIDRERLRTDFAYFCEVVGVHGDWPLTEAQKATFLAINAPSWRPRAKR
jgi:hypothetical protein